MAAAAPAPPRRRRAAAFRAGARSAVALALACAAGLAAAGRGFLPGAAAGGTRGAAARRGPAVLRRADGEAAAPAGAAKVEDKYVPFSWALDFKLDDDKIREVMESITDVEQVWPVGATSLTRDDFKARLASPPPAADGNPLLSLLSSLGGGGAPAPAAAGRRAAALDEKAVDTVFNTFAAGTWMITERDVVRKAIESWRPAGPTGPVDTGVLAPGIFFARLNVIGAWLFLNVFSAFAGYFIIFRPILCINFGIDLLPGQPRYWEN